MALCLSSPGGDAQSDWQSVFERPSYSRSRGRGVCQHVAIRHILTCVRCCLDHPLTLGAVDPDSAHGKLGINSMGEHDPSGEVCQFGDRAGRGAASIGASVCFHISISPRSKISIGLGSHSGGCSVAEDTAGYPVGRDSKSGSWTATWRSCSRERAAARQNQRPCAWQGRWRRTMTGNGDAALRARRRGEARIPPAWSRSASPSFRRKHRLPRSAQHR